MTWGGHFGVLDAAVPFWGATHAALAGAEKGYGAIKNTVSGGGGATTPPPAQDQAAYTYGRDPNAANAAVGRTRQLGDIATQYGAGAQQVGYAAANAGQGVAAGGQNMYDTDMLAAQQFNNRHINQGDFGQQNQTLAQLGGVEAQQGPSAAQAQLQSGTNQAMNSQLAMARSGRGFGGGAASAGLAQSNLAGIQANQDNGAAQLRASEDAAFRQRQAANLGQIAQAQGSQIGTNLQAGLAGQAQNDAMTQGMLGMGQNAYFQGAGVQQQGYGLGINGNQVGVAGTTAGLQGEQVANQIRGQEMTGGMGQQDAMLRAWAAQNGYTLQQEQMKNQQDAALLQGAATVGAAAVK